MSIIAFIIWLLAFLSFAAGALAGRREPGHPHVLNYISFGLAMWALINAVQAAGTDLT